MHKANIAVIFLFCLGFVSCDLFETRKPQDPSQKSSTRVPPTIDTLVLYNLRNAFRESSELNYLYCFWDVSFSFEATASARSRYANVFNDWDKSSEERYFSSAIGQLAKNSTAELGFGQYTSITLGTGDSTRIDAEYHLIIPHTKAGVQKEFTGHAQFTFARDQSLNWFIKRWVDDGPPLSDSTWSDLKGLFY